MEFLASLAIKALIGTSICGTVSVGAVYGYDKTLLGFKDNTKTKTDNQDGNNFEKTGREKEGQDQSVLSQTGEVGENGVKSTPPEDTIDGGSTSYTETDTTSEDSKPNNDDAVKEKIVSPTVDHVQPELDPTPHTDDANPTGDMSVTEPTAEIPTPPEASIKPTDGSVVITSGKSLT